MADGFSKHVFLCHCHEDKAFARALRDGLEARGVQVWFDEREIGLGDNFVQAMMEGLDNARHMALVVSPEFANSDWCREEWTSGLVKSLRSGGERKLIPICIRNAESLRFLDTRLGIRICGDELERRHVHQLAEALLPSATIAATREAAQSARLTEYLERLIGYSAQTGIGAMADDLGLPKALDRDTMEALYTPARVCDPDEGKEEPKERIFLAEGDAETSAPQFLSHPDRSLFVLLGDPGWGKSTVMRYLVYRLAAARARGAAWAADWDPDAEDWSDDLKARIPVFVEIKALARWASDEAESGDADPLSLELFDRYLEQDLALAECPQSREDRATLARERSSTHRDLPKLYLLDGLDEAPDAKLRRSTLRLATRLAAGPHRVLITCRVRPWDEEEGDRALQETGFDLGRRSIGRLTAFSDEAVRNYVRNWLDGADSEGDDAPAERFLRALRLEDDVDGGSTSVDDMTRFRSFAAALRARKLTHAPLLLALLLLRFEKTGASTTQLDRRKLYEDLCRLLLAKRETAKRTHAGAPKDGEPLDQLLRKVREYCRLDDLPGERIVEMAEDRLLNVVGTAALRGLMADQAGLSGSDATPESDVSVPDLIDALTDEFRGEDGEPMEMSWAKQVLKTLQFRERLLVDRLGALPGKSAGRLVFPHRTFLEFLAGWRLASNDDYLENMANLWGKRLEQDSVRNAIVFACEIRCGRAQDPDRPSRALDALLVSKTLDYLDPRSPARRSNEIPTWDHISTIERGIPERLASDILIACRLEKSPRFREAFLRVDGKRRGALIRAMEDPKVKPAVRLEIGRNVGWLGDEHLGVGVIEGNGIEVPDIAWVWIPPGEFLYGDGNEPRTLEVGFYIAKYPVTVRQYLAFADQSHNQGAKAVENPRARLLRRGMPFAAPNQPIVFVDTDESMAFCDWMTQLLESGLANAPEGVSSKGCRVRLPNELQWERAARGPNGRKYPWGDEAEDLANRMNCSNSGFRSPSPVGLYPNGAAVESGQMIVDLAGNVWERTELMEGSYRVFRGGCWVNVAEYCRSANRCRWIPGNRRNGVGFRVILAPPLERSQDRNAT